MTNFHVLDPRGVRDLAPDVFDDHGRLRAMPARYYEGTTPEERGIFGNRYAIYGLPTMELCLWLCDRIANRVAIEIGAGHGRLAAYVGMVATDSRMQDRPDIRAYYESMGQPTITYGDNVLQMEASDAVAAFRPQVVVGSWITHRYDPNEHWRGGNEYGPDLQWILSQVDELILIGNQKVHQLNPLWNRPHEVYYFPWIYSRAINGSPDFVAVWRSEHVESCRLPRD